MCSQKNHSRRRKRKFCGNQSVGPKKLNESTDGDNFCLSLRKLEKLFEDVPLLDEESNYYNIIINFEILKQFLCRFIVCSECLSKNIELEMIYHVAWVMLIKSTLSVETVGIKNPHIHQNNHINCQKVKDVEIGKGLEGIQHVTRCLNMFSIDDPSYQAINEELLSAYEYVAIKSMAKAAIEVSAKAHDVPLILTDAGLVNCEVSVDGSWQKRRYSSLN